MSLAHLAAKYTGAFCLLFLFAVKPVTLAQQTSEESEGKSAFVEANILSVFYHEFGHAVIDLMQVPIYGQEEDAADVVSVLLIDRFFQESSAQDIAYDSAFGYINDIEQTQEVEYWDLHGPDEQRFYNHVCLFYGANPDQREELAKELGLPEERAESCAEEYQQADDSWGELFDEMTADQTDTAGSLVFVFNAGSDIKDKKMSTRTALTVLENLLSAEAENINQQFSLPEDIQVTIEQCGEANAFYDPQTVTISICIEFVSHLEMLYDNSSF